MLKQAKGVWSEQHPPQKSPSPRHRKVRPHNSSPLKSLENNTDLSNVNDGSLTVGKSMLVGKQESRQLDGLTIDVKTSVTFSDSYDVHSELGRGKFAVVKKCRNKENGIDYAAKFQRKRRKGKDCRHELVQEVRMLEHDHPNLVQLVEVFETSNEIIIVTEYVAGGELFHHIMMEEGFEEKEVIRLLRQILTGLLYLHERDIVHLDVKPQNILLTADPPHGNIKLCDFGFARTIKSKDDVRDIIGTPDYVAPEVLSYEPLHVSCDMWSVGVLAYVMLTGCSPFAGENKMETFSNITQINYDFPEELFGNVSQHAIDFMRKLLKKEPLDRMTALQSLKHPWLYDDRQKLAHPISPTKSPFGSPLGCRRALTPSPGETQDMEEPLKKCKCAADRRGSVPVLSQNPEKGDEEESFVEELKTAPSSPIKDHGCHNDDSDQAMCSSTDDLDEFLSSKELLDRCYGNQNSNKDDLKDNSRLVTNSNGENSFDLVPVSDNKVNDVVLASLVEGNVSSHQAAPPSVVTESCAADSVETRELLSSSVCDNMNYPRDSVNRDQEQVASDDKFKLLVFGNVKSSGSTSSLSGESCYLSFEAAVAAAQTDNCDGVLLCAESSTEKDLSRRFQQTGDTHSATTYSSERLPSGSDYGNGDTGDCVTSTDLSGDTLDVANGNQNRSGCLIIGDGVSHSNDVIQLYEGAYNCNETDC